jgi:hypothetical protein
MPNLRVISDNAIDRATLTSPSTATNFSVASLQTQRKSDVWRAAIGTSAQLRATWAAPETLQAVALPSCNLSPTATMRVRVTNEAQATNLALYSQQFDNGAWLVRWGGSATVTANDATYTAPDGTTTVCKVVATTGGSGVGTTVTLTAGTTYTFSCWVLSLISGCTMGFGTSSTVGPSTATVSIPSDSTLKRYSKTFTPSSTGTYYVGVCDTASLQTFYIWGAQLEVGASPSSYYPTTSAAATRPLGYIDSWQSYAYDSGAVLACPAPAITLRGFTAAQAASAYAFGGGTAARAWLPSAQQAYGLAVDIVDTGNAAGYIEAAFLVAGAYWEAATNFDYGASAQLVDSTKNARSDAGDLISDAGTMSKKVSLPLSKLSAADRTTLWSILRGSGIRYPIFISMFPGDTDLARERDHQVYGKLVQLPAMALPFFNIASTTVEVESI